MAATDLKEAGAASPLTGHTSSSTLDRLETGLGRLVDFVAAALLLIDIALLGWAVTARYLLNVPVTWIEEVAMLVFLWFGMLGVASALRRKIHLRLTFVLSKLQPERRAGVERIAHVVLLVFLLKLVVPTIQLVELNHIVTTPNLSIPGSVPVLGSLVAIVLMAVFLLIQMWRASAAHIVLAQVVIAAVTAIGLELTPPLLANLGNLNLLLFFGVGVIALIVIGVPIAFAFGAATVGYFTLTSDLPLTVIVGRINEGMSHFILLTIPLFIFLGIQIQYTGMARAMINFVVALIGSARGGLSYVMVCAMYLVSGISGAKAADIDLLQEHHIRRLGRDHGGDALDGHQAVGADAGMDVVGEDAEQISAVRSPQDLQPTSRAPRRSRQKKPRRDGVGAGSLSRPGAGWAALGPFGFVDRPLTVDPCPLKRPYRGLAPSGVLVALLAGLHMLFMRAATGAFGRHSSSPSLYEFDTIAGPC